MQLFHKWWQLRDKNLEEILQLKTKQFYVSTNPRLRQKEHGQI